MKLEDLKDNKLYNLKIKYIDKPNREYVKSGKYIKANANNHNIKSIQVFYESVLCIGDHNLSPQEV